MTVVGTDVVVEVVGVVVWVMVVGIDVDVWVGVMGGGVLVQPTVNATITRIPKISKFLIISVTLVKRTEYRTFIYIFSCPDRTSMLGLFLPEPVIGHNDIRPYSPPQ